MLNKKSAKEQLIKMFRKVFDSAEEKRLKKLEDMIKEWAEEEEDE